MNSHHTFRASAWLILRLAAVLPLTLLSGCAIFGFLASRAPQPDVDAAYKGISGETVAILVDADEAQRLDFPNIEADIATAVQSHLVLSKAKSLASTRFVDPYSVVQFQRNHPEIKGMPVTDVAPRLGATRVLYVDLYRGSALGNVRVVEVMPNQPGSAKVTFKEDDIRAKFPANGGEGEPLSDDVNPDTMYLGTVQTLALEIAERFYQHPAPQD
jgi:hypothetical protein